LGLILNEIGYFSRAGAGNREINKKPRGRGGGGKLKLNYKIQIKKSSGPVAAGPPPFPKEE
jgi:hypothetical protein